MARKFREIFNKISLARQSKINAKIKESLKEMSLAKIRKVHQVSQEDIASVLQVKQSSGSKLE